VPEESLLGLSSVSALGARGVAHAPIPPDGVGPAQTISSLFSRSMCDSREADRSPWGSRKPIALKFLAFTATILTREEQWF
jgi:hypothetical protein